MVRRYIDLVGLAGFEDSFPAQLSGGMVQRVEVARALMARPDVLYMDEPFGALDALTRLRMRAELQRILSRDRHTCLLVTHDVEEALHLSDRVVVMTPRPGRIQCIVEVEAEHPRSLASAALVAQKQRVLRELGLSDAEVERDTASSSAPRAVARPRALRRAPGAAPSPARADVVVIGGGPAGASAAAILAENGRSVIVLEREPFPRYHVGESLLPALWELWDRLGVTAQIEAAGFVAKQGIRFARPDDPDDVVLLSAEYPEYFPRSYTYHVDRARFDALLLDNARSKGADVREGWTVSDVWMEGDWVKGVLAAPNGEAPRAIAADVVVDASGRDCLLARRMGWRRPDPSLNKVAHYTQFAGGQRSEVGAPARARRPDSRRDHDRRAHRRRRLALVHPALGRRRERRRGARRAPRGPPRGRSRGRARRRARGVPARARAARRRAPDHARADDLRHLVHQRVVRGQRLRAGRAMRRCSSTRSSPRA